MIDPEVDAFPDHINPGFIIIDLNGLTVESVRDHINAIPQGRGIKVGFMTSELDDVTTEVWEDPQVRDVFVAAYDAVLARFGEPCHGGDAAAVCVARAAGLTIVMEADNTEGDAT